MEIIKIVESLVKIRDQVDETKNKLEFLRRELDVQTGLLIEFLKHKRIIETRTL
jgi:hypothetical protein